MTEHVPIDQSRLIQLGVLTESIPVTPEALFISGIYGLDPELYSPAIQILINAEVLGDKADGWLNVGLHNILVGKVAGVVAEEAGGSEEEVIRTIFAGLVHDAKQRRLREEAGSHPQEANRAIFYHMSADAIEKTERQETIHVNIPGMESVDETIHDTIKVTSLNWDYPEWTIEMLALRYADSCVGALIDDSGNPCCEEDILGYDQRINILKLRKPGQMADWIRLFQLTQLIEDGFIRRIHGWPDDADIPPVARIYFQETLREKIQAQTPLPYVAYAA